MNEVRTLIDGRGLVESPRWHGDRLYFSDWTAGEMRHRLRENTEVIVRDESLPLCIDFQPDGTMIIVSSATGGAAPRVERRAGRLCRPRPAGWNDIVIDGRGNTYVNGAGSTRPTGRRTRPASVLVAADGSVRVVADDIDFPNGMAVTADNPTLIVAESYSLQLRFDIDPDGGLSNRHAAPTSVTTRGRHQRRRLRRDLVRRRAPPAVRPGRRGRRGPAGRRPGPWRFRLRAGGPARTTLFIVAARWQGMSRPARWSPRAAARSSPSTSTSLAPGADLPRYVSPPRRVNVDDGPAEGDTT